LDAEAEKQDRELYEDIIPFVRGESNTIQAGTIEMDKAKIAEGLVAKSPHLLAPHRWRELIEDVSSFSAPVGAPGLLFVGPTKKAARRRPVGRAGCGVSCYFAVPLHSQAARNASRTERR
jgi:hypothetical protein